MPAKLSLAELARNPNIPRQVKIAEVSRQFEAILLRQILQETRKTVIHSEFGSDSVTSSIYQDMVTAQLADDISQSGTFGLAHALQAQWMRQLTGSTEASEKNPKPQPSVDATRSTMTSQPIVSHE